MLLLLLLPKFIVKTLVWDFLKETSQAFDHCSRISWKTCTCYQGLL